MCKEFRNLVKGDPHRPRLYVPEEKREVFRHMKMPTIPTDVKSIIGALKYVSPKLLDM